MVMNPYSAGPFIASLNRKFKHPEQYEFAATDSITGWNSYIIHSTEIIEWVENMSKSDWETYVVEKEYGIVLVAHSMSPQLETMFVLRWS